MFVIYPGCSLNPGRLPHAGSSRVNEHEVPPPLRGTDYLRRIYDEDYGAQIAYQAPLRISAFVAILQFIQEEVKRGPSPPYNIRPT